MLGVAPVDVGFIRQSVQEVGNLLQMANEARLSEVSNLLALQEQTVEEVANVQSAEIDYYI
jgi:hypothetical protein